MATRHIDAYVTEPAGGVLPATGLRLLIHGWGNDGTVAYAEDGIVYADEFDLVVTRVENTLIVPSTLPGQVQLISATQMALARVPVTNGRADMAVVKSTTHAGSRPLQTGLKTRFPAP